MIKKLENISIFEKSYYNFFYFCLLSKSLNRLLKILPKVPNLGMAAYKKLKTYKLMNYIVTN